ncbi:MAG: arginine N-succinyltransferase, partial [Pseudomonadota bacterium]
PKHPVYLDLLPPEAQEVVGKPHDHGVGAMKILESEGFRYQGYIDIFDAGPCIESPLQDIATVKNSRIREAVARSEGDQNNNGLQPFIISNRKLTDYRILRTVGHETSQQISLSQTDLDLLHISTGDPVRIVER